MGCAETVYSSNEQYLRDFAGRSARLCVPLSGTLDLTHCCNLRCLHCYSNHDPGAAEMDTGKVMSLLDEICDAGCLYLLITGGEAILRRDFHEIYRYAKEKGFLITLFTNGTLITDGILRLFRELPPRMVEISLYGASAATYESITQVAGSYDRCIAGIRGLLDNRINVGLKTVLMTLNSHEFSAMEEMAKGFGARFRFDAAIFPRLNGDNSPLSLRVPAAEAVEKEFSDYERVTQWERFLENHGSGPASDSLYHCGAGVTGFYIDPAGSLRPCLMTKGLSYDLRAGDFSTGWAEISARIRETRADRLFSCNACEKRLHCGYCPGFFELENGDAQARSEYLCTMGNTRHSHLADHPLKGTIHERQCK